jgi:hypothetical protein
MDVNGDIRDNAQFMAFVRDSDRAFHVHESLAGFSTSKALQLAKICS